jgi:hypothetical protein
MYKAFGIRSPPFRRLPRECSISHYALVHSTMYYCLLQNTNISRIHRYGYLWWLKTKTLCTTIMYWNWTDWCLGLCGVVWRDVWIFPIRIIISLLWARSFYSINLSLSWFLWRRLFYHYITYDYDVTCVVDITSSF